MMHTSGRARTTQPMLALLAAAAITFTALVTTRPHLAGSPISWTGDDLAIAVMWWGAALGSAWLAVTTLVCVAALARGHTGAAHRIAGWAPPLVRRVLQTALISTWALVPAAAYAAAPGAPVTVHVGADGRLTTGAPRARPSDVPVVRTPSTAPTRAPSTVPPTAPARLPAPKTQAPRPVHHHPAPTAARPTPSTVTGSPTIGRSYVVRSGENLWLIAKAEVARVSGVSRPDDAHVARYWQRLIAANRTTLRSGDPSLIYPGEIVTLPNADAPN